MVVRSMVDPVNEIGQGPGLSAQEARHQSVLQLKSAFVWQVLRRLKIGALPSIILRTGFKHLNAFNAIKPVKEPALKMMLITQLNDLENLAKTLNVTKLTTKADFRNLKEFVSTSLNRLSRVASLLWPTSWIVRPRRSLRL